MTSFRFILLFLSIAAGLTMTADKVSTTRHRLKVITTEIQPENMLSCDTIANPTDVIRFCGYEKTLRSSRETIFIENLSDSVINKIKFTINYLDTSDRLIHSRSLWHDVEIPPFQARRIDIPSWDRQKTYYYKRGTMPRKSATPYDIKITADSLLIQH